MKHFNDAENHYREYIYANSKGGRWRYYRKFFSIETSEPIERREQIDHICAEYLTGFQWVLNYYFVKNKQQQEFSQIDWEWVYPYNRAPLVSDLVEFLENNREFYSKIDSRFNTNTQPLRPLQQLSIILPPGSRKLLPKPYQDKLIHDQRLRRAYPDHMELEYDWKKQLHEAPPKIPPIDLALVKSKLGPEDQQSLTQGLRPQGLRPNEVGRPQGLRPNEVGRPQGLRPNEVGRPQGLRPNEVGRPQGLRPNEVGRPQAQAEINEFGTNYIWS